MEHSYEALNSAECRFLSDELKACKAENTQLKERVEELENDETFEMIHIDGHVVDPDFFFKGDTPKTKQDFAQEVCDLSDKLKKYEALVPLVREWWVTGDVVAENRMTKQLKALEDLKDVKE